MLGLTHNSRHTTLRQISFLVSSGDLWTSLVSCRSNWDKSPVPELSSNITTSLKLMSIIMRLRLLLEIVWFMSKNFSSIERKWSWIINWHLIATWSMKDILLLRYPSIVCSVDFLYVWLEMLNVWPSRTLGLENVETRLMIWILLMSPWEWRAPVKGYIPENKSGR